MAEERLVAIPAGTRSLPCRSCKAPLYFVPTGKGGKMPVHVTPENPKHEHPTSRLDGVGEPHWGACDNAKRFRQLKREGKDTP
jgi:hypothetical protein